MKQAEMPVAVGVDEKNWSDYERGKSKPPIEVLVKISDYFRVDLKKLVTEDLSVVHLNKNDTGEENGEKVHLNVHVNVHPKGKNYPENDDPPLIANEPSPGNYLPQIVTVDNQGHENVIYVPVRARAGYLLGYGDAGFISKLPAYRLPGISTGTYRMFEVEGHSMFPTFSDKDRVVCRPETIENIKDDRNYVIVTRNDGILVKRVLNRYKTGIIICKSDHNLNGEYPPIILDINEVVEVWYVTVRMTNQMAGPGEIHKRMADLEADVILLKDSLLKGRLNAT